MGLGYSVYVAVTQCSDDNSRSYGSIASHVQRSRRISLGYSVTAEVSSVCTVSLREHTRIVCLGVVVVSCFRLW